MALPGEAAARVSSALRAWPTFAPGGGVPGLARRCGVGELARSGTLCLPGEGEDGRERWRSGAGAAVLEADSTALRAHERARRV